MNYDNWLQSTKDQAKNGHKHIPGGSQLLSKRPNQFSENLWPINYQKAKGAQVEIEGQSYLDMSIGGIGATLLGYANEEIDNWVINGIKNGVASSINSQEEQVLTHKLLQIHPWADWCKYTRSGGEALSVAIRIARANNKKDKVLFCGYHGWHDWYLSANLNENDPLKDHLLPNLNPDGVPQNLKGTLEAFLYNDLESFKKASSDGKEKVSAIVMEPIRSIEPDLEFLNYVKAFCDKNNCLLIFDEVSSGFRFSKHGYHKEININPDIVVYSKALGNGYPIAAIIGNNKSNKNIEDLFISSTSWTEKTGFSAALGVLDFLDKHDVHTHLFKISEQIKKGWENLALKYNLEINIGGLSPIIHYSIELKHSNFSEIKAFIVQEMYKQNILAANIFYCMYSHSEEDVKIYLEALDHVFKIISEIDNDSSLKKHLMGRPSKVGFRRMT